MTVIAVPATVPHAGLVLPRLADTSPLSAEEAAELYAAMFKDVVRAADASGGTVLVNYRAAEDLPDGDDVDPETELRALASDAVDEIDDVRFEPQVGSTHSARVGNTITHLLTQEGERSAAVASPNAALIARTHLDSAAMKLRTNGVVLGPSSRGRTYFAGFSEPIDFEDAYEPPVLETLTERAVEAGNGIEFIESLPLVETGSDLCTLCSMIDARLAAERIVPEFTTLAIDRLGLYTDSEGDDAVLARS